MTHSFVILNSRKRAVIALVHTLLFLLIAGLQLALSHAKPFTTHGSGMRGGIVLLAIYTIVSTVLLLLLRAAGCAAEKLYFSMCAASAVLGLLRVLLGDPVLHASLLRVVLLAGAAIIGAVILRSHSGADNQPAPACGAIADLP
jgi:hypothetical protein